MSLQGIQPKIHNTNSVNKAKEEATEKLKAKKSAENEKESSSVETDFSATLSKASVSPDALVASQLVKNNIKEVLSRDEKTDKEDKINSKNLNAEVLPSQVKNFEKVKQIDGAEVSHNLKPSSIKVASEKTEAVLQQDEVKADGQINNILGNKEARDTKVLKSNEKLIKNSLLNVEEVQSEKATQIKPDLGVFEQGKKILDDKNVPDTLVVSEKNNSVQKDFGEVLSKLPLAHVIQHKNVKNIKEGTSENHISSEDPEVPTNFSKVSIDHNIPESKPRLSSSKVENLYSVDFMNIKDGLSNNIDTTKANDLNLQKNFNLTDNVTQLQPKQKSEILNPLPLVENGRSLENKNDNKVQQNINLLAKNASAPMIQKVDALVTQGSSAKNRLTTEALNEISSGVHRTLPHGGGEIKIRLNPESLGEIHLRVQTEGNQVNLKVTAQSEVTKQILEESLSSLRESLGAKSLSLGKVDFTSGMQSAHISQNNSTDLLSGQFQNQNSGMFNDKGMMNNQESSGNSRNNYNQEQGYSSNRVKENSAYVSKKASPLAGHSVLNMDGRLDMVI